MDYIAPEFEVIVLNVTDVIATSLGTEDDETTADTEYSNDNEFDASDIFPF